MVQNQSIDELGLVGHLVDHMHDLNHVKVDLLSFFSDTLHGVHDDVSEHVGELWLEFGRKGGLGDMSEKRGVDLDIALESLEELKRLNFGLLIAVGDDSGVDSFLDKFLGLLEEITDD